MPLSNYLCSCIYSAMVGSALAKDVNVWTVLLAIGLVVYLIAVWKDATPSCP